MNSLEEFLYICINTIIFIAAVAVTLIMLENANHREDVLNKNLKEHSAVVETHSDDTSDEDMIKYDTFGEGQFVLINASDVYGDIISICEKLTDKEAEEGALEIVVAGTVLNSEKCNPKLLKEKNADAVKALMGILSNNATDVGRISGRTLYRRIYSYDDDLNLAKVKYEKDI